MNGFQLHALARQRVATQSAGAARRAQTLTRRATCALPFFAAATRPADSNCQRIRLEHFRERADSRTHANVNFAVSLGTLQSFLNANGVPYVLDDSTGTKTSADIAANAARYTILLECLRPK